MSDTTSIVSSVLDFRREHGRTYHSYKAGSECEPGSFFEDDVRR